MAEWITTEDVELELGLDVLPDPRLDRCVEAVRAAVERRRSELDFTDDASVDPDVRAGAIAWAALLFQIRSAPSGFAGYDAETALLEAGSRRAEIYRLLGWRRPSAV